MAPDFSETGGTVVMEEGQRTADIKLTLQSDDVPELDEQFALVLRQIRGGAEIDGTYGTSNFTIRSVTS